MEIKFPVFVRARDSGEVTQYSSIVEMQNQFEIVDVENDEYEAWDASGLRLSLALQEPKWLLLEASSAAPKPAEIVDAIRNYADASEVQVDLSGLRTNEFAAALANVKDAIGRKWQAKGWWERFKSRF